METEKKGFFRTFFGLPEVRSETPIEEEPTPAVPNMATNPPTWAQFNVSTISVEEALSIPAVTAAVTIITTTVSQLGMKVERKGVEIESALVSQPDKNRSQAAFFKRTATNLVTTGNAYWRIHRLSDNSVQQIECLAPSRVLVRYDDNGKKFYEYTEGNNKTIRLTNNEYDYRTGTMTGQVEHIKLFELDGHPTGLGPIQLNNKALAAVLNQRNYYERFLEDAKRPSGIYSFDDWLDAEEQAHALATVNEKNLTGSPMVLGKGVKYQTVMFTAEETALVEMQNSGRIDVSNIFGVQPHALAAAVNNSMTYQNVQDADRAFVRGRLEQYLNAVEDGMTNVLPRGQVAKFDTENWLRAAAVNTTKEAVPETDNAA